MSTSVPVLPEILDIALVAAPWLLVGLLAAGLVRAFVPDTLLRRWVGGRGLPAVARAAVLGAPLPLCSCGAIPTALTLYRGGAGRGPTTAFLIGTPGVGVDSLAVTYALLGPVMMVARIAGVVATAIVTGLLVAGADGQPDARRNRTSAPVSGCAGGCGCSGLARPAPPPVAQRLRQGLRYAFGELLDDIGVWILVGLVIAGTIAWAVSPPMLATYGSGVVAMLLMAVIGIPLYVCATAATPIAAAMVLAGVSPGTALVFLMAAPITSLATLVVFRREMGQAALVRYLVGIVTMTVATGLLLDHLVAWTGVDIGAQVGAARDLIPRWLDALALVVLVVLGIRPLRRRLIPPRVDPGAGPDGTAAAAPPLTRS